MNTNRKIGTLLFIEDKNMNVKAFLSKKFNNPTVAVVICDDEIKVGDKVIKKGHNTIYEIEKESDKSDCIKVLVLPNQFSQEFLQAIVDGKVKDGDKVEVEMEFVEKGNTCTGCEDTEFCILQECCEQNEMKDTNASGDKFKFWKEQSIKLRKDGTAIIHKYEETVEEAAETVLKKQSWDNSLDLPFNKGFLKGFELGADWQKSQK